MMVDAFIQSAIQLQNITKLNHQMWPCGDDFEVHIILPVASLSLLLLAGKCMKLH